MLLSASVYSQQKHFFSANDQEEESPVTMASSQQALFEEVSSKDFLGFKFGSRGYSDQLTSAVAKSGKLCAVKCEERIVVGRFELNTFKRLGVIQAELRRMQQAC